MEVENPLPKPFALPSYSVPNVLLSCDYLISVAPFKILQGQGWFSIANLLGLLSHVKYSNGVGKPGGVFGRADLHHVVADLYFTLPFDLGIIEARTKFSTEKDPTTGTTEAYGKIFVDEPFAVDCEAATATKTQVDYLRLISTAKGALETQIKR